MMANLEAISYIKNELAVAVPEAIFVIMGVRREDFARLPEGQGAFPENLVFTGSLPDNSRMKEAVFLLAEIAIAPMIHGTGSSLKIPDYLAHGKILLSTEIGARGHEALHPYVHLVHRDKFASALREILAQLDRDPAAFDCRAKAAREKVKATLDWSVVCAPLAVALRGLCRNQPQKENII